jgi:hypothetical protein
MVLIFVFFSFCFDQKGTKNQGPVIAARQLNGIAQDHSFPRRCTMIQFGAG